MSGAETGGEVKTRGVFVAAFRHASPLGSGVCYGRLEVQVGAAPEEAAKQIDAQINFQPSAVWTSPSLRCLEPASCLASLRRVPLHPDPRLLELNFGAWEGVPWTELAGRPEFESWANDWKRIAPPEGEALSALESRVLQWWCELSAEDGPTVLIAHAGVLRSLRVLVEKLDWDTAIAQAIPYLTRIDLEATPDPK